MFTAKHVLCLQHCTAFITYVRLNFTDAPKDLKYLQLPVF